MPLIEAPRYDLVNKKIQTKWVLTKWTPTSPTSEKGKVVAEFPYHEENEAQAEGTYNELQAYAFGNAVLTLLNNFQTI